MLSIAKRYKMNYMLMSNSLGIKYWITRINITFKTNYQLQR